MAGSSFFALLDDIASVMDDVAVLSKVAAKKTSGVLGDDLALNANQVVGLSSERELPVVYAVAKGSAINKVIIVPLALLISATIPWLITPILMMGGAYLCFEGAEKVWHFFFPEKELDKQHYSKHLENLEKSPEQLIELEKSKIKGAVRTDFILSAEIIAITLGTVTDKPLLTQALVLCGISFLMTVGVYGLVAIIVKLDDLGLHLIKNNKTAFIGKFLLLFAPRLLKFLSIAGTIAMFLVGGGIIVHGVPFIHHTIEHLNSTILSIVTEGIVGAVTGLIILFSHSLCKRIKLFTR